MNLLDHRKLPGLFGLWEMAVWHKVGTLPRSGLLEQTDRPLQAILVLAGVAL